MAPETDTYGYGLDPKADKADGTVHATKAGLPPPK